MELTTISTEDDFPLAARRFAPGGRPRAVVLLPAAMGVRQDFYFPFARFLAEHGFAALTFDYRGMGASVAPGQSGTLRGFGADLNDWAADYGAALRHARAWHAGVPLLVVGHSLGGQLPGIVPENELIDGIVTVAAGSGYWRDNALPLRRFVWLLWYAIAPLSIRICGYFPGKRLRMVGDLPAGVMRQWGRWCKSPHYISDEAGRPLRAGFDRIRAPVLSLSFTDDEMMSRRSIDSLHDCYRHAQVERRAIAPEEIGARRIGHFGFFREQFRPTLWQQALRWLEQRALDAARQRQGLDQPARRQLHVV
ncbi:MAG TPA: alpha/beta fold hydrolase [Noviherbaspirillum sp.]|nr:alpha/beta fold hydrolase [Noviherbaspirillum sp.]